MIPERYVEVLAERFHAIVAGAHPLATEFAYQFGIFLKVKGNDPTADAWPRFQDGDVPVLQRVGRS